MPKFINTSKINLNQSINYLLTEEKQYGSNMKKNPKAFINYSQTIPDVLKIQKAIIHQKKEKQ